MDLAHVWKEYLNNWPNGLSRKGVVVTNEEQIVFVEFLMNETVVMFERQAPDSMGGRKVIVPYTELKAIKVTEPIGDAPFLESGFSQSLGKRPARPTASATVGTRPAATISQKA